MNNGTMNGGGPLHLPPMEVIDIQKINPSLDGEVLYPLTFMYFARHLMMSYGGSSGIDLGSQEEAKEPGNS